MKNCRVQKVYFRNDSAKKMSHVMVALLGTTQQVFVRTPHLGKVDKELTATLRQLYAQCQCLTRGAPSSSKSELCCSSSHCVVSTSPRTLRSSDMAGTLLMSQSNNARTASSNWPERRSASSKFRCRSTAPLLRHDHLALQDNVFHWVWQNRHLPQLIKHLLNDRFLLRRAPGHDSTAPWRQCPRT